MVLGLAYSLGGLIVLALAADQFVRGAARLALAMRIAPVVVGAVVVGFGTSAPEMLVSGLAAAEGKLDIGVGAVIGSNVANVSLVLGAASFVAVLPVERVTLRREAPVSLAAVALFALIIGSGLTRLEGVGLALLMVGVLVWLVRQGRIDDSSRALSELEPAEPAELEWSEQEPAELELIDPELAELVSDQPPRIGIETFRTLLALTIVVGAAYLLVSGAERIADALNLSGGFIGYTLVAVGTSAPELVTAVVAARQNQTELLVGNLFGSNIFNALAVGGVIGLVGPGPVLNNTLATTGAGLMVLICVISWLLMMIGHRVSRRDGVFLLVLWLLSVVLLAGGDEAVVALTS